MESEKRNKYFKDLDAYISNLEEVILKADKVARKRGDQFGLCDCTDTFGNPYPSQWSADIIRAIRRDRGIPEPETPGER